LAVLAACAAVSLSGAVLHSQSEEPVVTTKHQVTIDGKPLSYTARAGRLPIRDNETGDVHGQMFFVSYTLPRAPKAAPRPVTFLWNGGPGSSSSLVHLLGFGPRRLDASKPIDNSGTWLDFSDLVFVDPIGTGYSRPVKAEYGPEFYQTRGDAESVAEFIRVYRNRFGANDAPLILAGESYGVTRAAAVAEALERRGVTVGAAILIGLALPLGNLDASQRIALNAPTYTATAFANRKLSADLQTDLQATLRKAEGWASTRYAAALARRDSLADAERSEVAADLARFTGFDAGLCHAALQRAAASLREPNRRQIRQPPDGAVRSRAGEDVRPHEGPEPHGHHRRSGGGPLSSIRARLRERSPLSGSLWRRVPAADLVPRRLDVGEVESWTGRWRQARGAARRTSGQR
jgi:carboxypeptidase C (cathepsin A)